MKNNKICIIGLGYVGLPLAKNTAERLVVNTLALASLDVGEKIVNV